MKSKKPSKPRRRERPVAPTFIEPAAAKKRRPMSRESRDGLRVTLFMAAFLSVALIVSIGVRLGFTVRGVVASGLCGCCIGAAQGPAWIPDGFRYPILWQAACGAIGGAGLAVALAWSLDSGIVAAGVGAILCLMGIHLLRILDPLLR